MPIFESFRRQCECDIYLFKLVLSARKRQHKIPCCADALYNSFLPGGFQRVQGLALRPDCPCWRRLPLQGCFLLRRSYLLCHLSPAQLTSGASTAEAAACRSCCRLHLPCEQRLPCLLFINSCTPVCHTWACRAFPDSRPGSDMELGSR